MEANTHSADKIPYGERTAKGDFKVSFPSLTRNKRKKEKKHLMKKINKRVISGGKSQSAAERWVAYSPRVAGTSWEPPGMNPREDVCSPRMSSLR